MAWDTSTVNIACASQVNRRVPKPNITATKNVLEHRNDKPLIGAMRAKKLDMIAQNLLK